MCARPAILSPIEGNMPASKFLIAGLTMVLIDLLLAGDNAFVIAMAVRHLPPRERRIGERVRSCASRDSARGVDVCRRRDPRSSFVKLAGGLFILWIAFQVLRDASQQQEEVEAAPRGMARAIWYVLVADLTMSTDNILAIAGASRGHFGLILFGLAVSIPFIVFSSNLWRV